MSQAHATLSASGSAKWLGCSAALALEALINEPDPGSEYADQGTAAHEVLYYSLAQNREPEAKLGELITVNEGQPGEAIIEVSQEMVDNVEVATEYIRRLTTKGFYEERVDYSHIAPNGFGTADAILEVYEKIAPGKHLNTLYIIDFKYGAGIRVEAFENSQCMLYALGALNSLDLLFEREIERVNLVVIQPRMDNISEFEISVTDLLKWGEEVKPKAQLAYDMYKLVISDKMPVLNDDSEFYTKGKFKPSKAACKWCQGRRLKRCKAHAHAGYSAAIEGFDDLTAEQKSDLPAVQVSKATVKDPAFLDSADLIAIWKNIHLFISFGADLDDEIIKRIKAGEDLGLRLISTENPRAWKDDDDGAIKAMRTAGLQKENYLKWSIISPTEAEKNLKEVKPKDHKRRYKRLEAAAIHRPPGKDKLIEDSRKPAEDFEDDLLS